MLSKLRILFWLGIFMLVLSFLGIPDTWKMALALGMGVVLIYLAFALRREYVVLRQEIKESTK